MKRVFGTFEAVFDILYLTAAAIIGLILLSVQSGNNARIIAGIMALILAFGDAFHLIPRIAVIFTGREQDFRSSLGLGKQITSITMTVFYIFLWHILLSLLSGEASPPVSNGGLWDVHANPQFGGGWGIIIYALAALRIVLCLLPQNGWRLRYPPLSWATARNVPFFAVGVIIAAAYFIYRGSLSGFESMWLAVALSFAFYLPVVLWANKNPKIGMLMLPKTCAYLWMIVLCLAL